MVESYTSNNLLAKEFYMYCSDFNQNNNTALPKRYNRKKKNNNDKEIIETEAFSLIASPCPIDDIEVIDIRIKGKVNEDDLYLQNDSIYNTIRRGNSVIRKLNSDIFSIGRMGLPKFFDYQKHYSHSKQDKWLKNRVVTPIEKSKGPYSVYFTEKANGENFQVSYSKQYQAWIVGSKNVCILVRDENDLEWYVNSAKIRQWNEEHKIKNCNKPDDKEMGSRFQYCLEFATLWLQIVKNKIGNRIDEFKAEMADHTFIGENVGNQGYQHIKHYNQKDAILYSIINNLACDKEICLPLSKSFEIFKKYNLSHVPVEPSGVFNTFNELIEYLNEKYDEILLKKVSEGGEGSVAYFVSHGDGQEKVVSLAKLKTFEYRFLRKIREKSKSIHKNSLNADKAFTLLEKESLNLIENLKDKVDFDGYLQLGKYMLKYAEIDPTNYTNVYADFIALMKDSFAKGIKVEELNVKEVNEKLIKPNMTI